MYPNPNQPHNMNPNGMPMQYQYNQPAYTYYNPYQNQPMYRNPNEPQYFNQVQPMQPVYYPYPQQQVYNPMYFQPNPNFQPQPMMQPQNHYNNQQHRPHYNQNHQPKRNHQENKRQNVRPPKSEIDPNRPEHSKDEIRKWVASRMKNFPSKANLKRKEEEKRIREETGEVVGPPPSLLEQKLRKKIKVLNMIDGRANRRKEMEKNYLLRYITNPYKKVKPSGPGNDERPERPERTENHEEGNERIEEAEEIKEVEEKKSEVNKPVDAQQDMYDAYKMFQMQINEIEREEGEITDQKNGEGSPIEVKCITQKTLDNQGFNVGENNNGNNQAVEPYRDNRERDRRNRRENNKKKRSNIKPLVKQIDNNKKSETIEEIIVNLKQKKEVDDQDFDQILEGRMKGSDFKYRSNTLLANLLIDTIYAERNVILQCLRYLVKEDFFEKKE